MHRFDFDFFGGFFALLFRLTSGFELSTGATPVGVHSTGATPVGVHSSGATPIG